MKKILLVAALIAAFATGASAQKEQGFGGQVEVGYGLKLSNTNYNNFQVSLMPGYHFGSYLFAGIGAGYSSYTNSGFTFHAIPVFAHATVNFTSGTTWTPFFAAKIGYGLGGKTVYEVPGESAKMNGGFYAVPSLGVKYKIADGHAISLALYYDCMGLKLTEKEMVSGGRIIETSSTKTNSALGLRLGWEF